MMAAEKWFYQVWVHCGQKSTVHLVETYHERYIAEKSAAQRNAAEQHDTPSDLPPRYYYYVISVTEEQLILAEKEKYRRSHGEYKKHLVQKFDKVLKPLAMEMATAKVFCLASFPWRMVRRLQRICRWYRRYHMLAVLFGDRRDCLRKRDYSLPIQSCRQL